MFENNRIIELARELGAEIQKTEEYFSYQLANQRNDEDDELQAMISSFNIAQMNLQRAMKETEKDDEKIAGYTDDLNEAYNGIMSNENMRNYMVSKDYMERELNFIYQILAASINGKDPFTVEESAGGCSGDCSSCGSCG
jgi:cell fate (sporulation/competence/biofilm development) regulator YlbF (YheA/YmcA/DUF963 family)